jgi:hypothetical protein
MLCYQSNTNFQKQSKTHEHRSKTLQTLINNHLQKSNKIQMKLLLRLQSIKLNFDLFKQIEKSFIEIF